MSLLRSGCLGPIRGLVEHNDHPDAGSETYEYRLRYKVRYESQAQEAGEHQCGARPAGSGSLGRAARLRDRCWVQLGPTERQLGSPTLCSC